MTAWIKIDSFGRDIFSAEGTCLAIAQDRDALDIAKQRAAKAKELGEYADEYYVAEQTFLVPAKMIKTGAYWSNPTLGVSGYHVKVQVKVPTAPFARTKWIIYV